VLAHARVRTCPLVLVFVQECGVCVDACISHKYMCTCVNIYMHVSLCVCIFIYICIYIYIYICMYIYLNTYIHVCIYI